MACSILLRFLALLIAMAMQGRAQSQNAKSLAVLGSVSCQGRAGRLDRLMAGVEVLLQCRNSSAAVYFRTSGVTTSDGFFRMQIPSAITRQQCYCAVTKNPVAACNIRARGSSRIKGLAAKTLENGDVEYRVEPFVFRPGRSSSKSRKEKTAGLAAEKISEWPHSYMLGPPDPPEPWISTSEATSRANTFKLGPPDPPHPWASQSASSTP